MAFRPARRTCVLVVLQGSQSAQNAVVLVLAALHVGLHSLDLRFIILDSGAELLHSALLVAALLV